MNIVVPGLTDTTIKRIDRGDAPELQALFARSADFFTLTEGAPPDADAAVRELEVIIPGREAAETFCLGVYQGPSLIAFLHVTQNYPHEREWWTALFIVDPSLRRTGVGSRIHQAVTEWIIDSGGTALWLAILEQNQDADRFWRKLGYVERERQPYKMANGTETVAILMSLRLVRLPA